MKITEYILVCIVALAILHITFEIINFIMVRKRKGKIVVEQDRWIGGIFYFNPDDPRIFVPKKIKWLGWTLNFAHPVSIVIVGIILIIIASNILFLH